MKTYILKKLLMVIPLLIGISIVVFLISHMIPGSAMELFMGTQVEATPEQMKELQKLFGEDKPLYQRYFEWLFGILRGDFGISLRTARPVLLDIKERFPLTLELTLLSLTMAILIGIPVGIYAAGRHSKITSTMIRVLSLLGLSIPRFWLATLLIIFFAKYFHISTVGVYVSFSKDPIKNIISLSLPALSMAVSMAAVLVRFTRTSMLEVMSSDYIRTARAKGLSESIVLKKHALKNALLPVITVIGFYAGYLLGGSIITEEIFALPGMGRLMLYAIEKRDYPLIQGIVLIVALLFILINIFVDILYGIIDPRIRYE